MSLISRHFEIVGVLVHFSVDFYVLLSNFLDFDILDLARYKDCASYSSQQRSSSQSWALQLHFN